MKFFVGIIITIVIFFLIILNYNFFTPSNPPIPKLIYNNEKIELAQADFNWFNGADGNTNIVGNSFFLAKNLKPISAIPEGKIQFSFDGRPNTIVVALWKGYAESEMYKSYKINDIKNIVLPKEKGIYIFEISGIWNNTHITSHIFKIKVE